jgi:hypothetical protein
MGRERNTDHRSDIRAQRGGMIPCVPSQDLCGVSTPNFGTRRLAVAVSRFGFAVGTGPQTSTTPNDQSGTTPASERTSDPLTNDDFGTTESAR